jgi:DNA-binding transcriptional MerR regulator
MLIEERMNELILAAKSAGLSLDEVREMLETLYAS